MAAGLILHPRNDQEGRVPAGVRCLCHDDAGTLRQPCPYPVCMTDGSWGARCAEVEVTP